MSSQRRFYNLPINNDQYAGFSINTNTSTQAFEIDRAARKNSAYETSDVAMRIEVDPLDTTKHIVTFPHKVTTSTHTDIDQQVEDNRTDIGDLQTDLTPFTVYNHQNLSTATLPEPTKFFSYLNKCSFKENRNMTYSGFPFFDITLHDSTISPGHVYGIASAMFVDIDLVNNTIDLWGLQSGILDIASSSKIMGIINTPNYLVLPHRPNTATTYVYDKTLKTISLVNAGWGSYYVSLTENVINAGDYYYYAPYYTGIAVSYIYYFDDSAGTFHRIDISSMTTRVYNNHMLASDGKIYYTPANACYYILVLDTSDNSFTEIAIGLSVHKGWENKPFVEGDNGAIYLAPYDDTNIIKIILSTSALSTIATGLAIDNACWGGILATNGKIYWAPYKERNVLILTCSTDAITLVDTTDLSSAKWKYAFQQNNTVYFSPYAELAIGYININSHVFDTCVLPSNVTYDYKLQPQIINEKMFFKRKLPANNIALIADISADSCSIDDYVGGCDSWCFSNTDTFYCMTDTLSYYKVI